jgi:hypothetical protein
MDSTRQDQLRLKQHKNTRTQEQHKNTRTTQEHKNNTRTQEQHDTETSPTAFTAFTAFSASGYKLRDSFILDSGADTYVCNDRSRFHTFQEATTDDNMPETLKFRSVNLDQSTSPSNVAYIPTFHTSVVSLRRFTAKNVYWDREEHANTSGSTVLQATR